MTQKKSRRSPEAIAKSELSAYEKERKQVLSSMKRSIAAGEGPTRGRSKTFKLPVNAPGRPTNAVLARAERLVADFEDWIDGAMQNARQRSTNIAMPSPDEYAARFPAYAEAWNTLYWNSGLMLCPKCGRNAARPDARAKFCSDTCSAAARNEGRQKVGGGRSSEERARLRGKKESQRHFASHKNCPSLRGGTCTTLEAILRGQLAIEESPARARQFYRELGHTE